MTDGTTNASVPKGTQVEAVTMQAAVELLAARAGMSVKKGRGRKTAKVAAKKSCAEEEVAA